MTTDELTKRRDALASNYNFESDKLSFKLGFDAAVTELRAENEALKAQVEGLNKTIYEQDIIIVDSQNELDRHKELLRQQCNHSQDLKQNLEIAVKAGKHLADVLEHAIELGHYTEGGSTEGWAKLAVKEWNDSLAQIAGTKQREG